MITYNRLFLRVAEIYFGENHEGTRADIFKHLERPDAIQGVHCSPFYTLVIDLRRHESELLSNMDRNTRYEIQRGQEKDNFSAEVHLVCPTEVLLEFCQFYDRFAAIKGLRKVNRAKLRALRDASSLTLSFARQGEEAPIVWHSYIRARDCARLLLSASLFRSEADQRSRQLAGRANRFLHWADMLRFKAAGLSVLDMGGWYEGTADQDLLRINAFKKGFGGEVTRTFNAEVAGTLKGDLALRGLGILRRIRS